MKRYLNQHGDMVEHPNGAYVDIADAQALERKVAEMEREVSQLRAMLKFADARINHSRAAATARSG